MKSKKLCKVLSLLLSLLMALSCVTALCAVTASAEEEDPIVIALDPGHGPQKTGTNGAVEYGGINEHFYTFSMATYAKERLEQFKGVEVHLTRTADNTPELMERPQTAANLKADAFVSIHLNAANKKAGGTEIWVPNDSWRPEIAKASRAAGQPILDRIVNTFGLNNRGFKTSNSGTGATYPDGSPADKLTVIKGGKELNIPVVMLIEVA
ncbi:MAG: N-acetylmuramoyl-L-alanine amidase, partial [Clostridia bacterium]|nr:N-acetylmuramoyl-L-alanine amidase [Clostridia bacterium]